MRLIASYFRLTIRQGVNYVQQTPELRLLAAVGLVVYVLCSFLLGIDFGSAMSKQFHETVPATFAAWLNRRLLWGVLFIAVVTLLATIATLFQHAQRDELERLRLLPVPNGPFFCMRVMDICLGVLVFLPLLVALPVVQFFWMEGLPLRHAAALLAAVLAIVLMVCFAHMGLAVAAARLVPQRLVQRKSLLYATLAVLGALLYAIAALFGRRATSVPVLETIEPWLPGTLALHSIRQDEAGVWSQLGILTGIAAVLGAASYAAYTRLYLRHWDLLMDKLVAESEGETERPSLPERLMALLAPLVRSLAAHAASNRGRARPGTPSRPEGDLLLALAQKEVRSTLRDPSVHMVAFFAILFVAFPGLVFSARDPALGLRVTYFLTVGTLLLLNMVLGLSSIGREGMGLGLISGLPVRMEIVLLAKAISMFVFHVFLSAAIAAGALILPLDWPVRVPLCGYVLAASLVGGAPLALLATGLGAIFPKFDARNQFMAVTKFGVAVFFGLATLLVGSATAAVAFPALFGPAYLLVPATLLALWGFIGAVLYVEGSKKLRGALGVI